MADINLNEWRNMSAGFTPPPRNALTSPFNPKWGTTPVPLDSSGRPLAPEFRTVGNAETGLLNSEYNLQNNFNSRGVDAIASEALRDPGTMSRWGTLALNQAKGANAAQNAGAITQAQNQLAMSGGLRGGARERLAATGAQNTLKANQTATANIQTQDELNRQKWLGMLPQMDMTAAQYQTGLQDRNIGRALTEINAGRGMQQQQYNEAMRAWGADKQAQAARAAAGSSSGLFDDDVPILGGCFLTTACVEAMGLPDDCWALELARKFRDTYMAENLERAKEIKEYYEVAPQIVKEVDKTSDAKNTWKKFFWTDIVPFVDAIEQGQMDVAHNRYRAFMAKAKAMAAPVGA